MKKNNNLYKLILPLLIVAIFPLSGLCADDFYTDDSAAEKMMQAAGEETPEKAERVIKDIEVHGLNVISPETVLEKITLKKGDKFDRNVVQNDLRTIYQMGYFTEKMRALPVNNPDGTVTLKLILEENSPVTDFTIEGNTVVSTEEILNTLMDMKGKPQNIAQLNQAIVEIQDIYNSKGYILSRVESVSDDPDGTINIKIKEGVVNSIAISGNEKTKDFIIARNIMTEPGTVYNENQIKEDLVRLYATQAFKDVTREIEPTPDDPDLYDVTINVQEQRTANISVGGGLDSVTGVFGSIGIADNNFRGRNQRVSLNGLVGSGVILNDASIKRRMNMQAELSFFEPHFLNADTSLMAKLFFRDFGSYQVPLAIERRFGGEATVAHRMKKNKHLTSTFSLGVEHIDVREGDFNKIASMFERYGVPISERAKQLDGGLFMSLSPALIYDSRDSGAVTRKGTIASIRFSEELGLIDFDKTHGKLSGTIKHYIPIGKKSSLSFMARGGGKIHGDNMPDVMAYRLGGPYTIRGFKMSGVGTGDAFIMGSAEFATPIPFLDRTKLAKKVNFLNNIRFTVWADAGKIFNPTIADTLYDRPGYAVSMGIGLKLYIPGMGPLSIDYGFPLTNAGDNGPDHGYFTFGVGDLVY
ncbi:BamA/TamA family outer membrane protein [Spirochaetes bacterium]|uniref:BamA/TamA family outer membrane protein n=1 Tax=Candidatus Scatousia excrementipullorum TaxID=2840936 RepID=A0A9D9DRP4_9BACT|nr:BamA/TamA family outer membrane protein [Candidatus Scatousia excrementipullorum]